MIVHAPFLDRQFAAAPAAPAPVTLPLLRGTLLQDEWRPTPIPGRWSRGATLSVACPQRGCGDRNEHHWTLLGDDGDEYRSEERYCPRCRTPYLVSPWRPADHEFASHAIDPKSDSLSHHDESTEWRWFEGPARYYILAN